MRRIRYAVAMSLDGYIAGPDGEADWIVMDPGIDFQGHWAQFDTLVMGRGTFKPMPAAPEVPDAGSFGDIRTFVASRTLRQSDHPHVTILSEDVLERVAALREEDGKDIWLFGGGQLFKSLAEAGLVDTVEVGIMPVLLGGGIPLLPGPTSRIRLELTKHNVLEKSGIVGLEYAISAD